MSYPLPAGFVEEIRKQQQETPFVWLWQVTADTTTSATTTFYLARNHEAVTWGGVTWNPWNMSIGDWELSGGNDIPTMTLSLDNTTRVLSRYLEIGQGFIDTTARCYIVNTQNLGGSPSESYTMAWLIAGATQTAAAVKFRLELVNWNKVMLPQDRYNAQRCRHEFGGTRCGYVINGVAAYTTCDKTLAQCVLRGLDMQSRGLPKLQPERFGGFVGIPVQR